jgi:hypothetical protein
MDEIQNYLQDVINDMEASQPHYQKLLWDGVKTYPIPFFGDVKGARVLTVGVNPSTTEFVNRNWPQVLTASELNDRLQKYFLPGLVAQHGWFRAWSKALAQIGVSYQDGAAHLDLSPRATVSMRTADQKLFAEMVEQDAQWFFRLIPLCSEARLLIFSGCVTKWYINKFMERIAPKYGFQFEGRASRSGEGRTGFYHLRSPYVELPAFFCSVSPSGGSPELLIKRIEENKQRIGETLDLHTPTDS